MLRQARLEGVEADPPPGLGGQASVPLDGGRDLAGDSAQRLLSEAERLVQTLGQLCQALRPSSQSSLKRFLRPRRR